METMTGFFIFLSVIYLAYIIKGLFTKPEPVKEQRVERIEVTIYKGTEDDIKKIGELASRLRMKDYQNN